jgi:hypothetical protein
VAKIAASGALAGARGGRGGVPCQGRLSNIIAIARRAMGARK